MVDRAHQQYPPTLGRPGHEKAWWAPLDLPESLSRYIGLEAAAESISIFDGGCVPGLLQTEDYIRAMLAIEQPPFTETEVSERVTSRLKRQELLNSRNAPRIEIVLDEAVLHHVVGSRAIMRAQLERLLHDAEMSNVALRIIPFSAGTRAAEATNFTILTFGPDTLKDIVYLEVMTGGMFLEAETDFARYRTFFGGIADTALTFEETTALVTTKLLEYRFGPGGNDSLV